MLATVRGEKGLRPHTWSIPTRSVQGAHLSVVRRPGTCIFNCPVVDDGIIDPVDNPTVVSFCPFSLCSPRPLGSAGYGVLDRGDV